MYCSCLPELFFAPHFLKVVVGVKALGPPHVLKVVVGVKALGPPHVLKIVVGVKALGPPHVLEHWYGVSKGMFSVKYFCSIKSSFCVNGVF